MKDQYVVDPVEYMKIVESAKNIMASPNFKSNFRVYVSIRRKLVMISGELRNEESIRESAYNLSETLKGQFNSTVGGQPRLVTLYPRVNQMV